jgi:hypothetical protein
VPKGFVDSGTQGGTGLFSLSDRFEGTVGVGVSRLEASDSVKVSDLLEESFPLTSSGIFAVSSVATPSAQAEVSGAFDISC